MIMLIMESFRPIVREHVLGSPLTWTMLMVDYQVTRP